MTSQSQKSNPEDEKLIFSNAAELAEALQRHASQMQQEFSSAERGSVCEACCDVEGGLRTELHWEAIYHSGATLLSSLVGGMALLGGHGWTAYKKMEFATHHRFCRGCQLKIRVKRHLAELAQHVCFAILLVGVLAFVSSIIFSFFVLRNHPSGRDVLVSVSTFASGIIATLVGWFGASSSRRAAVPKTLRRIARNPFALKDVILVQR